MLQVPGHSADMHLDRYPSCRVMLLGSYWAEADEAACAADSGALQHESSELPDGEAAFLHKQDPDARRDAVCPLPLPVFRLSETCLALLTCAAVSSSMAGRFSSVAVTLYRITFAVT